MLVGTFDVIICGGGTAGCVLAARLSEDANLNVLLLEAGGEADAIEIRDPKIWMRNIGSERDWSFKSQSCVNLNGREAPLPMGRVLGGGSSINGLVWARGHKSDFDLWEEETRETEWGYEAAVRTYKKIEAWSGPPSDRRGLLGPMQIGLPIDPSPIVEPLLESIDQSGIPRVDDYNAEAMEGDGCCAVANTTIAPDGTRVSTATAYLAPSRDRPNLNVHINTLVRRLLIDGRRVIGVEVERAGTVEHYYARHEVILSLGAIQTPKVLMHSGIGDRSILGQYGIDLVQHLPGVGQNLQDHILVAGCVFEYRVPEPPRNNSAEMTFFCKSNSSLAAPDLQPMLEECAFGSEVTRAAYQLPVDPAQAFTLAPGLIKPKSRGRLFLTSADPRAPVRIESNFLQEDADVQALLYCLKLCREIGNSDALRPWVRRELMPGPLGRSEMTDFLRNAAGTYFHETCTAKMGIGPDCVVDPRLKVYGVSGLRIADGSIMPSITGGNTMAPCVLIGERAAEMIASDLRATLAESQNTATLESRYESGVL